MSTLKWFSNHKCFLLLFQLLIFHLPLLSNKETKNKSSEIFPTLYFNCKPRLKLYKNQYFSKQANCLNRGRSSE